MRKDDICKAPRPVTHPEGRHRRRPGPRADSMAAGARGTSSAPPSGGGGTQPAPPPGPLPPPLPHLGHRSLSNKIKLLLNVNIVPYAS